MKTKLNFCHQCGKKLILVRASGVKVLFCKKCQLYFPYEQEWIALPHSSSKSQEKSQ